MTAPAINGATRLYAILGDPIVQVRSPELYTALFAAAGMNAVMVPMQVRSEQFDTTVPALMALGNIDGLIVTVPHKARAVDFATKLGKTAALVRALNALRREKDGSWTGDMFDGLGFVRGAERKGYVLRGRKVALFGAGGAGSAIGCELANAGAAAIFVIDPQGPRAAALAETLRRAFPACAASIATALPAEADMIVNASAVGMRDGDGLPGAIGELSPQTLVGDVVVSDAPTPIIRHAMRCGCPFVAGRDMFNGQSEALMAFFTGA